MKSNPSQKDVRLKGRAVVLQSGGCTAVINQSLAGVIQAACKSKQITGIWGSRFGVTGLLKGDFIDLGRQPAGLIRIITDLPSAALGSTRHKLKPGEETLVLKNLKKWNIRYLFLIGGNDTAQTAIRLARAAENEGFDLRVIHIPKTIDNDLVETDHSPGYGSVARFAAITTQEAGLDTKAICQADPVKIIELMGRNSGWIVAASALLKGSEKEPPHILCFPEVPFNEKKFLKKVSKMLQQVGYCVIVISETIRNEKGERIGARKEGILQDAFGHQYVEGAAAYLARLVERKLGVRARFDKPGTIQRMSIPYVSPTDQKEAFQSGVQAVQWALKGLSRVMVSFARLSGKKYAIQYQPVPLEKIPGKEFYLPTSFMNSTKDGISSKFVKYALPLAGGNLPVFPGLKKISPKL